MDSYRPKDATSQDREAGLCTTSQYPTQAARMTSGDIPSQLPSQSQAMETSSIASSSRSSKRVTLMEVDQPTDLPPKFSKEVPVRKLPSMKDNSSDNVGKVCHALPKYEERVSECIRQDTILPMDVFVPEDVRAQAQVAGLCPGSQYHTQAARMVSGDVSSQFPSQSQASEKISSTASNGNSSKRIRLTEDDNEIDLLAGKLHKEVPTAKMDSMKKNTSDSGEVLRAVPDVAAAIEDLLAQSNKIQDIATPGRNGSEQSIFSSDCSILGQDHVDSQSVFGISKHWLSSSATETKRAMIYHLFHKWARRKAFEDPKRLLDKASRILEKLIEPGLSLDAPTLDGDPTVVLKPGSACNETAKVEASNHMLLADYSVLFGEEFTVSDDHWDSNYVNALDVGAVEEAIFHVLYACASHPILCRKLADNSAEFWSVLPLVQALLPGKFP